MLFENKKWNWDGYSDRKDNSRWWKMFEKFANQYGKRILQCKRTNTLVKTQHKSLFNIMKASVVKWFNRTLKNDMWKQFTHNGNYEWIDLLSRLASEYNAWKRRTISMRSINVTPTIADKLLNIVYSSVKSHSRDSKVTRYVWVNSRRSLRKVTLQIGPW